MTSNWNVDNCNSQRASCSLEFVKVEIRFSPSGSVKNVIQQPLRWIWTRNTAHITASIFGAPCYMFGRRRLTDGSSIQLVHLLYPVASVRRNSQYHHLMHSRLQYCQPCEWGGRTAVSQASLSAYLGQCPCPPTIRKRSAADIFTASWLTGSLYRPNSSRIGGVRGKSQGLVEAPSNLVGCWNPCIASIFSVNGSSPLE